MQTTIKDLSIEDFRSLIRQTVEETLEDYLEDHAGLSSDAYLRSIEEAREDFRAGRVTRLDEITADVRQARLEHERGEAPTATPDELMAEIPS